MNKVFRSLAIALMLLLMTAVTATAGGWAVITLDELPGQIVAGQSFTIGFTVRQHGRTLRDDLVPLLRFDRSDAKDSFIATAKREGDSGHYVASVTLPDDGQWNWKIDIEQFGMVTQDMSPLTVVAAAPANAPAAVPATAPESAPVSVPEPASVPAAVPESAPESAPASVTTTVPVVPVTNNAPLVAGVAGVIVAIGALAFWLRTRARLALVVVAAAGLIGAIGFATAGTSVAQPVAVDKSVSAAQPVSGDKSAGVAQPAAVDKNAGVAQPTTVAESVSVAAPDPIALGRALFVDKGCVMCHAHPAVTTEYGPFWMGDEPPELFSDKYSAEYMRQWLKDPPKFKPDTKMPKLHLSDDEIGALIAFLSAK